MKSVTNKKATVEEEEALKDGMKRLHRSCSPRRTHPQSYTPLPDVPVDAYNSHIASSSATGGEQANWLLTKPRKTSVNPTVLTQEAATQYVEQGDGRPGRGRLCTPKSSHGKGTAHKEAQSTKETLYSVINRPRRARPLLSQIFGEVQPTSKGVQAEREDRVSGDLVQNGPSDIQEKEYKLLTVRVSKKKQSLGK